ncbi:MAG: glycosyltransferase family 39 protein [Verrucomicrobiales bacterium]|jgi:hypothetical protein|nr:glycosyltransferase family 39 protein [Verrucomicrobiales bacterium]
MRNYISPDRWKLIVAALSLSAAAVLLFTRLGHYSLWADEAIMALSAKGVMATGDTSVVQEHGNIVAYGNGLLLRDLCDRMSPPLYTYLAAGSFAVFGVNPWAARLPSVLLGLAAIALILYWVRKQPAPVPVMLTLGLMCNVPLLLSIRQCRYYAPAVFFSTLTVFLYCRWRGGWRGLAALAAPGVLLWASNYMLCAILGACLLADWLLWRRRETPLTVSCLPVLAVAALCCGTLLWVWNPWRIGAWRTYASDNDFADKLRLTWWYFRDLNVCEYYPALTLVATAPLAFVDKTIRRLGLALVLYITLLGFASQQTLRATSVADVRYAAPLIPLAVALTVAVIWKLTRKKAWLALPLSAVLFFTNIGNLGMGGGMLPRGVRSTISMFVRELAEPVPEPFGPTAEWINKNVPDGAPVYVVNGIDGPLSLMFAAPRALYIWQLDASRRAEPQFAALPAAHFKGGGVAPDYMIGFGPYTRQLTDDLNNYGPPDVPLRYQQVAKIDVLWKDLYRPELFWRVFKPITGYNKDRDVVFIFKRSDEHTP